MPYPRPRPILKHFGTSSDDSDSAYSSLKSSAVRINGGPNKVHFPNHPDALTRTHLAHSPDVYDRSPISIQANACALPERGCPGRTYNGGNAQDDMDVDDDGLYSTSVPARLRRSDHSHPSARMMQVSGSGDSSDSSYTPSLVQDSSDMSDDSDNVFVPSCNGPSHTRHYSSAAASSYPASSSFSPRLSPKAGPAQLAFLPYPHPSPHSSERSSSFYPSVSPTRESRSARRSPASPTRQRNRSRSRVRGSSAYDRHGSGNKQALTRGGERDEGCLGGF